MSQTSAKPAKQFRFQLAPLVDLLLIIVFAQFMEVRETVSREEVAAQSQVTAAKQQLVDLQRQLSVSQSETSDLTRRLTMARQRSESIIQQTNRAMTAVADSFLFDEVTAEQIETLVGDEALDVSPEVERISREVANASPEEIVRFLVGHAELLKRAEIWHLHATNDRRVLLFAGNETTTIRLERERQDDRTSEIEDQLFGAYKQLPQPKGLVVILVSYSPDSIAGVYQPLINGMPKAVERMRTDLPASRFEYTILGTTPLPDVLLNSQTENLP